MEAVPQPVANEGGGGGQIWTFAGVEFDERTLELRVKGQAVELERKSLEVLRQLLYRAGEIATKEELLEAVWPNRILSETVLAKCVSRIRQVLEDDEQAIVKTIHGYGYRLVAPVEVRSSGPANRRTQLELKAGDRPPQRPQWQLAEHLGTGGQGEVWLCRHEKLPAHRVFKFALDEAGLTAIKREITLHRLLREMLGERKDLCPVLDWNLTEPPCFIELAHAEGGNLANWADSQGGLAAIPLAQRIGIVVQIAEALAAAHSVGVLHKDLKPSNILMARGADGQPQPQLTDFGSGSVLDPVRLEAMGITRLGFTQTVANEETPATAIYVAPEVMTGQPGTVQADIYSLGVILYQAAAGDFRLPLAPGWELRIDDALLREDIAAAVAGERANRLTDVGALVSRLRTLDERRVQRAREEAEKTRLASERADAESRARQAELTVARLRARRNGMLTALSVLIVGMGLSIGLWVDARRARNEARTAAASSQAVADFLSKDMFAVVGDRPVQNLTVIELLDAAGEHLGKRASNMPGPANQIHQALGNAYWVMASPAKAAEHLRTALDGYERTDDIASAAMTAAELIKSEMTLGRLPEVLPRLEGIHARAQAAFGEQHPAVLELTSELAFAQLSAGHWLAASDRFVALVKDLRESPNPDPAMLGLAEERLVSALRYAGHFQQAVNEGRALSARLDAASHGADAAAANAHSLYARALTEVERFAESEAEIRRVGAR